MTQTTPITQPGTSEEAGLKIWSCVHCRRRKLKCERREPCSNCVKSNIECHFPVTGRLPRRSRDPIATKTSSQKQAELLGRLRRLEAIVTELGAQMEDGVGERDLGASEIWKSLTQSSTSDGRSQSVAQASIDRPGEQDTSAGGGSAIWQTDNDPIEDFGSLVVDANGTLRVSKGFWSIFCNEVDNIFQAVADQADTESGQDDNVKSADDGLHIAGSVRSQHQGFILGDTPSKVSHDDISPLPSQMLYIWNVFCENVDPFIKVLHVPTVTNLVRGINSKLGSLEPEQDVLMFAVSLGAITSLPEDAVLANFNVPKARLLARYRLGTERALARANFAITESVMVVQAFIIYLSILPHLGAAQIASSLTGLLVHIAYSMKLHRDLDEMHGSITENGVLDVELRRRLWWNICLLDSKRRHPDMGEHLPFRKTTTTGMPCNTNDAELLCGRVAQTGLSSVQTFTDSTVCLIRCELMTLSTHIASQSHSGLSNKLQALSAARVRIQETYIGNPHPNNPLPCLIRLMVILLFEHAEFAICLRHCQSTKSSERAEAIERAFQDAVSIIETTTVLRSSPDWAKWQWQLQGAAPWQAVLFALKVGRRRTWDSTSERILIALTSLVDVLDGDEAHTELTDRTRLLLEDFRGLRENHCTEKSLPIELGTVSLPQCQVMGSEVPFEGHESTQGDVESNARDIAVSDSRQVWMPDHGILPLSDTHFRPDPASELCLDLGSMYGLDDGMEWETWDLADVTDMPSFFDVGLS